MSSSNTIDAGRLKRALLELVESDPELRYALMGLLGYREILERITRLEERFARLEERFAGLAERQQRLEERMEQVMREIEKLWREVLALRESQQRLEERQQRVEERLERLDRTLATVAHRFGVLSEHAFREAMRGILEEYFGATAHRWSVYDAEGLVYGYPSEVEVDVVVRDGVHILVEVKSRVDTSDVLELSRIARLYEKQEGVRPELAILGGFVDRRAERLAQRLGIKLYTYLEG
ncbi:PD-(D/E)XK nuclease family protein [Pyrodictium abyssi]|uniref:DUF3782 domain-containing protein n=1 Tax=Pyrodictium abyssi TaxID=54256 RepID=A0ABN6ZUA2_9CREN|nr:DUF3782 domain-containing protein [Pyrodictium abyssi]